MLETNFYSYCVFFAYFLCLLLGRLRDRKLLLPRPLHPGYQKVNVLLQCIFTSDAISEFSGVKKIKTKM